MRRYIALGILLVACESKPMTPPSNTAAATPSPTTAPVSPPPARPDPQLQADLDSCQKRAAEKDKLIQALQEENARLQTKSVDVKIDDRAASAASQEFLAVVEKSRGAIQSCHKDAIKRNTGLASRTVTLSVVASFDAGVFKSVASSPSIGDTFDACIRAVAAAWTISNRTAMTFRTQITLTP